jgi:hypothetical protein
MYQTFGKSYEIPLINASTLSKVKESGVKNITNNRWEQINRQNREWLDDEGYRKSLTDFSSMYNIFDYHKDSKNREKALSEAREKGNMGDFEQDLLVLLDSYVLADIRKKEVDKVLPTINAYLGGLVEARALHGIDMSTAERFLKEAVLDKLFSAREIKKEDENLEKAAHVAKGVAFAASIAFSPKSGLKALINGAVLTTLSTIGDPNNTSVKDFWNGFKGLNKALSIVMGESLKGLAGETAMWRDIQLTSQLNKLYGMNQMDVDRLVEEQADHKTGALNLSKYLGVLNSAPDYVFRMTMFVMKMLQDGSYKAHDIDSNNGFIRYRPEHDGRYKKIFKFGKLIPRGKLKTNEQFQQRALFDKIVEELSMESDGVDENGLPTRAYTLAEKNSIKDKADMLFGNYDRDSKIILSNNIAVRLVTQFNTWMMSRFKRYWYNPSADREGLQGKYIYKTLDDVYELDDNGNKILDKDGKPIPKTVMEWQGDYFEGMLTTLFFIYHDMDISNKGSLLNAINDPDIPEDIRRIRKANLRKFLSEILTYLAMAMGLPNLMSAMFGRDSIPHSTAKLAGQAVDDLNMLSYTDPDILNVAAADVVYRLIGNIGEVVIGDKDFGRGFRDMSSATRLMYDTYSMTNR